MLRNKKGLTLVGLIVALVVILAIGFGIYKIFFTTKFLKIKDLEDMYIVTPRSSIESGWTITADYGGGLEGGGFGDVDDNSNEYYDSLSFKSPQQVSIIVDRDPALKGVEIDIQAGDRIELTYDGGQRLLVYLPRITREDFIFRPKDETYGSPSLYVAFNGSTYYDKKLTQLAQSAP